MDDRVQGLRNQYLRTELVKGNVKPFPLRVIKTQLFFPTLQFRNSVLAALRRRLQIVVVVIQSASQTQATAASPPSTPSDGGAPALGRGVKRERGADDEGLEV